MPEAVAFTLPILPGKTDTDREVMHSFWHGERQADFRASRERHGITREAAWIQETPDGNAAIIYLEADNLDAALQGIATSTDPFDRWFRDYVRDVHGYDLEESAPPPELVLDYSG